MPFYIVWSHCVGVGFCQSLSILWKQCARVDLSEDLTHFSSLLSFLFWLRTPRIFSFASKYLLNMSPSTAVHWGLSCIRSMDFFCALFFPKMQNDKMNWEIPWKKTWRTDAWWRNGLQNTVENYIPIPDFYVWLKYILSASSVQKFQISLIYAFIGCP